MEGMGIDYDPEDKLYYFSYWSEGITNKTLSFRQKLRYCWNVITSGKAFNDELIFRQQDVNKMITFLKQK